MSKTRQMILSLDDDDYATIQEEIAERQMLDRQIASDGSAILPEGDSNLAGAILAECVRDLREYRVLWSRDRKD